jgi:hypothetical protein
MEFVPPMALGTDALFEPPISPQSNHSANDISFPHTHPSGNTHYHAHTAPPQVVFDIRSGISQNHSGPDGLSSGSMSHVSMMSNGADNDLDISPLTSPWLGAAGSHHQSSVHEVDSRLHQHHVRSASFSHLGRRPSAKRPADRGSTGDLNSADGMLETEPARKKHNPDSPSALHGLNTPRHYQHLTPLTLFPQQPTSPVSSPISPLTTAINATNMLNGAGANTTSSSASGTTTSQRRTYRGSKSTGNTPLLRGQRSRIGITTRGSTNNNYTNNAPGDTMTIGNNSSSMDTPSSVSIGTGAGMFAADTPSPVDLCMPPPAPPDHVRNPSPILGSGASGSGSNPGAGSNSNQDMDGMGPGGMLLPVTPASIMKLGKLGPSTSYNNSGGGNDHSSAPRSWPGKSRTEKKGGEKEKDGGGGKGKGSGGGAVTGGAPTSIAAGRTRRNTTSSTAAAGGAPGHGLKAILPGTHTLLRLS